MTTATRTRKAPTGAKHDRCIGHVEHPYPAKGMLCYGAVIGKTGMIDFADHLASVAAARKATRAIVPARPESWTTGTGKARRLRPIGKDEKGRNVVPGTVCIGNGNDGGCHSHSVHAHATYPHLSRSAADAAKLAELVARFRAMRGLPVEPTFARAPVRKAPRVKVERPAPVVAETPALCAGSDAALTVAYENGRLGGAESAGMERCPLCNRLTLAYLTGAPREVRIATHFAAVQPESDTYAAAVARTAELTPTCNGCDAIGPVHPVTGYCAACQADAERDTEAAEEVMAAPETHLPAVIEMAERVLSIVQPSQRPTCERCGQVFRVKGAGAEWHRVNRPDCARVAVAV